MSDSTQLLARILMSIVFIVFGYLQFTNIAGYAANPSVLKVVALTGGVLSPTVIAYLVAAIDLLGGILILIGFQTHRTALVLIIFCICTLFIAHNFWTMEGPARAGNMGNFYKNLALIGGLLLLMNSGPGAYSVDAKMAKT
jgi:putative oxidoreductase